jgi:exoribonuclease-2
MGDVPVYDKKGLEELRVFVEPVIKDCMTIKRKRIRYWTLKYLKQHKDKTYNAVLIDELRRKYRIVLCDFFLIAEIARRDGVIMRPGEEFPVKVEKVDPWDDIIKLVYG